MQFKKEGNRSYTFPARKCNRREIITAKAVAFSCSCRQFISCRNFLWPQQPFFFKLQLIFLLYVRQAQTSTECTERLVRLSGVVVIRSAYTLYFTNSIIAVYVFHLAFFRFSNCKRWDNGTGRRNFNHGSQRKQTVLDLSLYVFESREHPGQNPD